MSRVEPNRNVYVGHRYVPKIMGEWDKQNQYEGLSIVTHQGTSYTSKKRVPVGIDILNEEFWVVTGNYNAQIEEYRKETERVSEETERISEEIKDFKTETNNKITELSLSVKDFGATGDGVTDDTGSILNAINYAQDNGKPVIYFPPGEYVMNKTITITPDLKIKGASRDSTIILFQGVDGFKTNGRANGFNLSNITIKDELNSPDSIGIDLTNYSSYHRINNINIMDWGQWGIKQKGGLFFEYKDIVARGCGRVNGQENGFGGTFYLHEVQDDNEGDAVTTGIIESFYCRSGGRYGLYAYRVAFVEVRNFLVEYHQYAIFAQSVSSMTLINFYEEANRRYSVEGKSAVYLKDCPGMVFITPRISTEIEREWENISRENRNPVFIDRQSIHAKTFKTEGKDGELMDIVARGSNTNGEYIKFSNGLLMCYKRLDGVEVNETIGSMFKSEELTWTYPHPFNVNQPRTATGYSNNGSFVSGSNPGGEHMTYTVYSLEEGTRYPSLTVWGSWK